MINKIIKLKVAEAIQDDVNKGIVRIDSSFMHELGIRSGDIVEIKGERVSYAIADRAFPGDIGLNIIRMDGIMRRNAKTGIGEIVQVKKALVKEAKRVTIAPAQKGIVIRASPTLFKQGLLGRVVMKGDIVSLGGTTRRRNMMMSSPFFSSDIFSAFEEGMAGFGFGDIKFVVTDTEPKQAVIVSDLTDVRYNPEAVEFDEEKVLDVTYEDVGGLHDEIKKVREMIELPLKHPEIFERLGIEPPKGVLLHGPPGTGKTLLAKAVANETNSHFILINGPEVMCVSGDTKIFTNSCGYVKAKEIYDNAVGKKIRDDNIKVVELEEPIKTYAFHNNKIVKSQITHVTKLEAPAYKIKISDGNELVVSHNQPFLVYENGNIVWKRLEELQEGMFIARINKITLPELSKTLSVEQGEHRLECKNKKFAIKSRNISRSNFITLPQKSSPHLLEFIGYVVSEGYVAEDSIIFTNNDAVLRERFKQLLVELFGIHKTKEYHGGRVVVYSKTLVLFLKLFGLMPGKKIPQIPSFFYTLPKQEIAAFIQAYFDGDGCVALSNNYPTPKIFSISKEFLQDLQGLMLLKLDIPTKLNLHNTPHSRMYELVVRGAKGRETFCSHIKPISKEKKIRLNKLPQPKKEWANIPVPELLISALKNTVPYKAYRNNDYYMYGKGNFTQHALKKLYLIANQYNCISKGNAIEKEYSILTRNDIAWEQIEKIGYHGRGELYDFTVKHDSFVAAPYLLLHNSKYYGQSEQNIRKKFEEAEKNAPSIIFIDEIDAIAVKREDSHGEVERRVVAQLLAMMDGLKSRGKVVVIAATNIPDAIDPALRRPGRFDREIEIGVPGKEARLNILKIHTRNMPLTKDFDLKRIADITHGFVGADLASLSKEAAMVVLRRLLPELKLKEDEPIPKEFLEKLKIGQEDFMEALKTVRPSAMREVLVEIPNIRWDDVGGLSDVKQELKEAVEWPLKYPDAFTTLGVKPPQGILLYGPPGTGKTLLAKAVAKESEANFILVKGPELLSKWFGESEKAVRKVFKRARQTSPSIIFFDEIDALAPRRGVSTDTNVTERVVNQLLTEMDGLEDLTNVVIIAATNRPDILDTALLRPGRFDRIIHVPVPDEEARKAILAVHTKTMPLASDVNIDTLAKKTEGYAGADIEAVCREAAIFVLREDIKAKKVTKKAFEKALEKVKPSVTKEISEMYRQMQDYFKQAHAKQMEKEKPSYYG